MGRGFSKQNALVGYCWSDSDKQNFVGVFSEKGGEFGLGEVAVFEEALATAFAAEAGLFVATEGGCGVEFIEGVAPDDAGFELAGDEEVFGAFFGPDSGAEAVGGVVGFFDGFCGGAECEDGEDGAEDFRCEDGVALGEVGGECGGVVVAAGGEGAGGLVELGAVQGGGCDDGGDAVELGF